MFKRWKAQKVGFHNRRVGQVVTALGQIGLKKFATCLGHNRFRPLWLDQVNEARPVQCVVLCCVVLWLWCGVVCLW